MALHAGAMKSGGHFVIESEADSTRGGVSLGEGRGGWGRDGEGGEKTEGGMWRGGEGVGGVRRGRVGFGRGRKGWGGMGMGGEGWRTFERNGERVKGGVVES